MARVRKRRGTRRLKKGPAPVIACKDNFRLTKTAQAVRFAKDGCCRQARSRLFGADRDAVGAAERDRVWKARKAVDRFCGRER